MTSKNDQKLTADQKSMLISLANRGDLAAKAVVALGADKILTGGLVGAPTNASTQATGSGATAWRVNVAALLAQVDGALKELVAQADVVIHSATQLVTNGQSCIATVVLKIAADGTASIVTAKGAAATTGSQVAPTAAAVQTAVGAGLSYLELAEVTLNRTGDTTVTETYNNTKREVGLIFG
jgi:hypothetical protein